MGKYIAHIRADGTKQTCTEHCINTATIAFSLLSSVGLSKTGYLAGLLHDMGKFNDQFLNYIQTVFAEKEYKGPKVIHTFTGVSFILDTYHNGDNIRELAAETIALAIGSHHGLFDIYHDTDDFNAFIHRLEKQPNYDKVAIANFFNECIPQKEIDKLFEESVKEISEFCRKVHNVCNKPEPQRKCDFYLGLLSRLILSAVIEGDRRDTADFMNNENHDFASEVEWNDEINSLNNLLKTFPSVTAVQKARKSFSDACCEFAKEPSGVYRLDLPTGGGKTLSSLRYALNHAKIYGKRRIFYVAPLLTILEQNASIIKNALPSDEDILIHYSNLTEDSFNNDMLDDRELLLDSWESKIIITTLVQMLQTMFSGKMSSVRRFNALSNSVIIFDEIQSLPMKVYSMFNLTVNFLTKCCGTTIILCSATLPLFDKADIYPMIVSNKQIIPQELIKESKQIFKRTDIKKWKKEVSIDEIPDIVINRLNVDNSILVVCNKKNQATQIFNSLRESLPEEDTLLFHLSAGMCPKHRKDTLRDLTDALATGKKLICISTQVIEAGIDISFSCVFRFAAGLDSVIQSAGRCNRHGSDKTPHDVFILKIEGEQLRGLKEIEQSKSAVMNLLDEFERMPSEFENDLSSLTSINYYYNVLCSCIDKTLQDYPNPKEQGGPTLMSYLSSNKEIMQNGVIRNNCNDYYYKQAFSTAGSLFSVFDDNQTTVLVPYNEEARYIIASIFTPKGYFNTKMKDIFFKAKDYSVSIFTSTFVKLQNKGAIKLAPEIGIPCLLENYYDDKTGVSMEETTCNSTLIL